MKIQNPELTARQAAEQFAQQYSEEGREVGTVLIAAGAEPGHNIDFQFVGGVRWYGVRLLPDFSGWDVEPLLNY